MARSQYGREVRQERAMSRQQQTETKNASTVELPRWAATSRANFIIEKARAMEPGYKKLSWSRKELVRTAKLVVLSRRLQNLEMQIVTKQGVDYLGLEQLAKNLLYEFFGPKACCSACGSRDHELQILSGNVILRKLEKASQKKFTSESFFGKLAEVTPLELRTGLVGQKCCGDAILKVLEANLPPEAHRNDRLLHWPGTKESPGWLVAQWVQRRANAIFEENRKELWRLQVDQRRLVKAIKQAWEDLTSLRRERCRCEQSAQRLVQQLGLDGIGDEATAQVS